MILLGVDIGGTKVETARVTCVGDAMIVRDVVRTDSAKVPDLAAWLKSTVGPEVEAIGIGVAGPVFERRVKVTNLPWEIDASEVERALGIPVTLVNDLAAHAYGLSYLGADGLSTLNVGRPKPGNRVLIAAGTGLGEALLFWDGTSHRPSATEGGHTDFASRDGDEIELLSFLLKKYERVSVERVVSGRDGWRNLHDFLVASGRVTVPEGWRARLKDERDIGRWIGAAAAEGQAFASEALRWFCRLYGAEAGNLALKGMAVNGVYVGGGIAARHVERLKDGEFMTAFAKKGRFSPMLAEMPVHVVVDPHAALKGAAAAALARGGCDRSPPRPTTS